MSNGETQEKKKRKLRKDDLRAFARLVAYAKPYWFKLAVGAVASMIGGGSILGMLLAAQTTLGYLVDHRAVMDGDDEPEIVVEAVETAPEDNTAVDRIAAKIPGSEVMTKSASVDYLRRKGVKGLLPLCGLLMLFIALNSLCQFASMYCLQWVGQRVVMDLREALFAHLQRLPLAFYNSQKAGDTISRTVADTQLLQTTVSNVITDAIRKPVMIVLGLATVLVLNWKLALFSVVLVPTVVVPIIAIGRKLRRISRDGQKRLAELTSVMKEALDGVTVVKAFGQEERMEKSFNGQCRGFFRQMIRAVKAKALNEPISHTIGGLGGMGVLVYAMATGMAIERCFIFAAAIWWLYDPIKKVGRIFMEIQQSSGAADRVFEILDAPVTVSDAPDAVEPEGALQTVDFKDVRFRYGDKTVFDGLNLSIKAGESLAVVGPSGGGKTTLGERFCVQKWLGFAAVENRRIAEPHGTRSPGYVLVQRHDCRKYRFWQTRCHSGRNRRSGCSCPRRRVHTFQAGRLRHCRGRARHGTVRRAKAANRDRQGAYPQARIAGVGRSHFGA